MRRIGIHFHEERETRLHNRCRRRDGGRGGGLTRTTAGPTTRPQTTTTTERPRSVHTKLVQINTWIKTQKSRRQTENVTQKKEMFKIIKQVKKTRACCRGGGSSRRYSGTESSGGVAERRALRHHRSSTTTGKGKAGFPPRGSFKEGAAQEGRRGFTCLASFPRWARSCRTWVSWPGPRSCRSSSACRCGGKCPAGWWAADPPGPPGQTHTHTHTHTLGSILTGFIMPLSQIRAFV